VRQNKALITARMKAVEEANKALEEKQSSDEPADSTSVRP